MRFAFFLSLFALLFTKSFTSFAQERDRANEEKPNWKFKDRIFVGGGVQAQFGTVTVIGASPIVGYKITPKLSAGVGLTYLYYRVKYQGYEPYKTHIYGGNVFGRYLIWKNQLFVHTEYGFVNWEVPRFDINLGTYTSSRMNVPYLNLGGGYRQPIGDKAALEIFALYDVLHGPHSFSPSPFTFRAGVNVGF